MGRKKETRKEEIRKEANEMAAMKDKDWNKMMRARKDAIVQGTPPAVVQAVVNSAIIREAEASCALDGRTQCGAIEPQEKEYHLNMTIKVKGELTVKELDDQCEIFKLTSFMSQNDKITRKDIYWEEIV